MLTIKPSPQDLAATHPFTPTLAGYSPRTLLKCSRALPYPEIAIDLPNFHKNGSKQLYQDYGDLTGYRKAQ